MTECFSFKKTGTSLVRSLEETEKKAELLAESELAVRKALDALRAEHEEQTELCKQMEECSKEVEAVNSTLLSRVAACEEQLRKAEEDVRIAKAETEAAEKAKSELQTLSTRLFQASQMREGDEEELESARAQISALERNVAAREKQCIEMSAALDRKMEVERKKTSCFVLPHHVQFLSKTRSFEEALKPSKRNAVRCENWLMKQNSAKREPNLNPRKMLSFVSAKRSLRHVSEKSKQRKGQNCF